MSEKQVKLPESPSKSLRTLMSTPYDMNHLQSGYAPTKFTLGEVAKYREIVWQFLERKRIQDGDDDDSDIFGDIPKTFQYADASLFGGNVLYNLSIELSVP